MRISDFRSDTVTKPTDEMRRAMAEAEVGDDVLGDDPTVLRLEKRAAERLGKEAGLFVPTGTMGNSIAIKAWTQELDEVIIEARSHIYNMESTHMTFISRVNPRIVSSDRGAMDLDEIKKSIKKPSVHHPRTSLICVENTHNNWGGAVVPLRHLKEIKRIADAHQLKIHMDGARIFNAYVASGTTVENFAATADSVMFCLSKGLCAPIGSMLVGPADFIDYSRRLRKALGGGMRQVGVVAAAGLVAMEKMVDRLADDHRLAKKLAEGIAEFPEIILEPGTVETDIVIFGFNHPDLTVSEFLSRLKERGILALPVPQGIRMVANKEVNETDVDRTIAAFKEIL
jgi:threonine aldolase